MSETLVLPAAARAQRRSGWCSALVLLVLMVVATGVLLMLAMSSLQVPPLSITIDGEQVMQGLDLAQLPPAHKVLLVGMLMCSVLALLVIVPVALVVALGCTVMLMLLVVGLPLLVVCALALLLLSPLLVLCWLVWKLVAG